MNQLEYQRELIAFDEKISLGKLEVAMAEEAVKKLEFEKAKFNLQYVDLVLKSSKPVEAAPPPNPGAAPNAG